MRLSEWWLNYRIRRLDRRIKRLIFKCRRLDAQGKDHFLPAEKFMTACANQNDLMIRKARRVRK